jgi:Phage minor capsid protein 2
MPVDPEDVEAITRSTVAVYQEAEQALVGLVRDKLAAGLDAPDWAATRLGALSTLRRAAEQLLARLAGGDSIRRTVAEAYRTGRGAAVLDLPAQFAPRDPDAATARARARMAPRADAMESLAAALVRDLGERRSNVLRHVEDQYRRVIAGAVARSIGAGITRRQAAQQAWQGFVDQGVASFTDRRGRTWRLSSYTEMAVRTVTQRAAVQGQTDRLQDLGADLVIISDSPRECPLCRPWEGKILRIGPGPTGRLEVESMVAAGTVTMDVAGTLDEARADGLFHPNCTHSARAYLPGATRVGTRPAADPEGNRAQDRQRAIERQIRRWKEREDVAIDPAAAKQARTKVKAWQGAMRDHLDANPALKRQPHREQPGAGSTPPRGARVDPARPLAGGPDGRIRPEDLDLTQPARPAPVKAPARATPLPAQPPANPVTGTKALAVPPARLRIRARNPEASILDQIDYGVLEWRGGRPSNISQQAADRIADWLFNYVTEMGGVSPADLRAGDDTLRQVFDQLMDSSPLPEPIQVWRGLDRPELLFGDLDRDLSGVTVPDPSVLSTSTARSISARYATRGGTSSGGLLMRLQVPAGVKAVTVGQDDREILLQRGLRITVLADRRERGMRVLDVVVSP